MALSLLITEYFVSRESVAGVSVSRCRRCEMSVTPCADDSKHRSFGLVPLLFSTGPGSEVQRPLAIVVIGGLVSATLLTLILLSMLYLRFGQSKSKD